MDTLLYIITSFIIFFLDIGLQRSMSVTAAIMSLTQNQCVGYLDLKDRTDLQTINVMATSMQYFPEGDCNSTAADEESRVLVLPSLRNFRFTQNRLLKMPNVTGMTGLIEIKVNNALFPSITGKPFINNIKLQYLYLEHNKLVEAPNLEGGCTTLYQLLLHHNRLTNLPNDYFNGCK